MLLTVALGAIALPMVGYSLTASAAPTGGITCSGGFSASLSATVSEVNCLQVSPATMNNTAGQPVTLPTLYRVCTRPWTANGTPELPAGCSFVYRLGTKSFTAQLASVMFDPDRPEDFQAPATTTPPTTSTTTPTATTTTTPTATTTTPTPTTTTTVTPITTDTPTTTTPPSSTTPEPTATPTTVTATETTAVTAVASTVTVESSQFAIIEAALGVLVFFAGAMFVSSFRHGGRG